MQREKLSAIFFIPVSDDQHDTPSKESEVGACGKAGQRGDSSGGSNSLGKFCARQDNLRWRFNCFNILLELTSTFLASDPSTPLEMWSNPSPKYLPIT